MEEINITKDLEEYEDPDDIHYSNRQLKTVSKKIMDSTEILESNKKKLMDFKVHLLGKRVGLHKTSRYLYDLHNMTVWLGKPFEETTTQDMERVMVKLDYTTSPYTGRPYAESSKRGFRVITRKFYKWFRNTREYPDEVYWIPLGKKVNKEKMPEDMLSEEEALKLISGCLTIRDKAMIALAYDLGARIGEVLTLKIRDLELFNNKYKMYIKRSKTGNRKPLLVLSYPFLNKWISVHPNNKDQYGYIFCKSDGTRISYSRASTICKEAAKRINIIKKVNTHNFRHSRISMYSGTTSDRVLMKYFGIKQAATLSVYSHLSDEQVDDAILLANGKKSIKEIKTEIVFKKCPNCEKENEPDALYCNCGYPLDEKAALDMKIKEQERDKMDEFMNMFLKDKDTQEFIKQKIKSKQMSEV